MGVYAGDEWNIHPASDRSCDSSDSPAQQAVCGLDYGCGPNGDDLVDCDKERNVFDVPMKIKQPIRLETAAASEQRIRQPQILGQIPQNISDRQSERQEQAAPRTVLLPNEGTRGKTPPPAPAGSGRTGILPGIRPGQILRKGQRTSLMQANPGLDDIEVCLGWTVKNPACDLDASAFLLGADGKVPGDDWFVFYGQTTSPDGSVQHYGDVKASGVSGDMEKVRIRLGKLDPNVKRIVVILTIDEAFERKLNFGMVADTYIRVVDKASNTEIVRFMLEEYYDNVISMIVGEIYERDGTWRFHPVGNGVAEDLAGLCERYGVRVEE